MSSRPNVATPLPPPSLLSILRAAQGLSGWDAAAAATTAPELVAPAFSPIRHTSQPGPRLQDVYLLKVLMVPCFLPTPNSLTRLS